MLRLMECEFLKLKRRPLVFISLVLSVFMPLAYIFFLSDVNTDVDAVNGVMSSLFQLSAYLLLMPLLVILASSLLFQELDHDTLKNLAAVPVDRTKLVLSKMLVLLLFAVGFMAGGRPGESCGPAGPGMGAGWVLDAVLGWAGRGSDHVGRSASLHSSGGPSQ